jgi:hypothetical protein
MSEETPEPWYKDGLNFTCTGCGNCCTGAPGAVWVDDEEIERIAEHLGKSVGEVRLMHTRPWRNRVTLTEFANGDCTFFDGKTRRCSIYPVRPTQCRTWPFWQSNLATEQDWTETQKECPGAGNGEFVSIEKIEQRLVQINI